MRTAELPDNRVLDGLDALEAGGLPPERAAGRAWRATWPKAAALGLAVGIWQAVVWSGWRPDYVLPPPATVFAELRSFLGGDGPDGIAVLRLRPSFWTGAPDAYLEELYVAPPVRRRGIGRALLEAVLTAAREAGAARIDLGTSEDDTAALALYESFGFTNREGGPDGPRMLFYERDL